MVNPERLQELLLAYAEEAKLFFYSYGLGDIVLEVPIDHVAVKALNRNVYEQYLRAYLPLSRRLSYETVGQRDIALAELYDSLDAGNFGLVSLVEIMEPKPGSIATTHDLIDHIELLVPDLEPVKTILSNKAVEFKEQSNDNHMAVVIPINEWGQEVKFTDHSLLDIAEQQLKSKIAKIYEK